MADPYNLQRFVTAQDPVIETVLAELRAGRKRSHWMWFVFPQLRCLGLSERAVFYGLADLAEATAYLAHPVLGPRLVVCTEAMLANCPATAFDVLGSPDDMKFRSSMTLFGAIDPAPPVLADALAAFYAGPDARTLDAMEGSA